METCDDGQSRHYCLARTCRPHSELTSQLIWKQLCANKWAEFCKDPAVTPPEAADPTLLFFLSCRHLLSGSILATITASPTQQFLS